jgi:hypothetical protein
VIKIRYSAELQPGLHGKAERHGRHTVLYLLPTLTQVERKAVLRRLRQQSRMNIGPPLPVTQLAVALLADRVRTSFARAGAVVRKHPAGSALPVIGVVAGATFLVLASGLSIRVVHEPQASRGGTIFGAAPTGSAAQGIPVGSSPAPSGRRGGATGPSGNSGSQGASAGPTSSPAPGASPSPSPTAPGGRGSGSGGSGGTTLSSVAATAPASPPSTAPVRTPAAGSTTRAPSPTPSPSPSSSGSSGNGLCVSVGSLGICLTL